MNHIEFFMTLERYVNATRNVRAHCKPETLPWTKTGIEKVPDFVIKDIGKIVSLLSEICPLNRSYLIYNFQHISVEVGADHHLFELGVVEKSLSELDNIHDLNSGQTLDFVVNAETKEIINSTQALKFLGFIESAEAITSSITYGSYWYRKSPSLGLESKSLESDQGKKFMNAGTN